MDLDLELLHQEILAMYRAEHAALTPRVTLEMLERAQTWKLAPTLASGGVLVFPHAGVQDCGHQVAAVVQACLDSGADQVLVVSVLHAFTDEMEQARRDVANGADPTLYPCRGIQGPGLDDRQDWQTDHVLMSFRYFWEAERRRRGIQGPRVIERYPYLAGGHPETLPGIEDMVQFARNSVIVSTADAFHHGIGYGDPPEKSLESNQGGLDLARTAIEEGMKILGRGDYWGYNQHCVCAKSDARDAGQVFRYLRGEMTGRIIDLTHSDAAALYHQPSPTWVAATFVEWQPV